MAGEEKQKQEGKKTRRWKKRKRGGGTLVKEYLIPPEGRTDEE